MTHKLGLFKSSLTALIFLASCTSDCKHCDLAHEAMFSYAKEQKSKRIYLVAPEVSDFSP